METRERFFATTYGTVLHETLAPNRPNAPVVMTIGAHPDDETMLAGGTLAFATLAGLDVEIVAVTRGEGGEVGQPPVTTQERLGVTREAELRCAARRLGARGLTLLPYHDPLLDPTLEDPALALFRIEATPEEFEYTVVGVIRALRPAALLTHGSNGEYGHPQHIYTHEVVRRAFATAANPNAFPELGPAHATQALYTWAAYYPTGNEERLERLLNRDDPAEWRIAVTGELHARKAAAADCHRSQHDLFLRRNTPLTIPELVRWQESLRRVALAPGATDDPLGAALAADRLGVVSR